MDEHIWNARHAALVRARISNIYNRRRERYFEAADRLVKCISLIGGSAMFARAVADDLGALFGLAVAVATSLSLVFQFSSRAWQHSGFARDWAIIEGDILGKLELTSQDLCEFEVRMAKLESQEPRYLRALVADCQNEIARAENQEDKVRDLGWRKWVMHFLDVAAPPPHPAPVPAKP